MALATRFVILSAICWLVVLCGGLGRRSQHLERWPRRHLEAAGSEGFGAGTARGKSVRCFKEKVVRNGRGKEVETRRKEERIVSTMGEHSVSTAGFDDKDCTVRTWEEHGFKGKGVEQEGRRRHGSSYGHSGSSKGSEGKSYRKTYSYSHEYPARKQKGEGRREPKGRGGEGRWQAPKPPKYSHDLVLENHLQRSNEVGADANGAYAEQSGSPLSAASFFPVALFFASVRILL